jgi:DNA-binding response OmpR family regulator
MEKEKNKRILWIEDDYYHLQGLVKPLKKEGFEIIIAKCYEDAKKILDDNIDLDMVLLDLIIPYSLTGSIVRKKKENDYQNQVETPDDLVENGINLFNYIRKDLKLNIPIIILSIVSNEDIINRLNENGANEKLQKLGMLPLKLKEVVLELLQ